MIAGLLPPTVTAVEAFDDVIAAPLFPAEETLIAKAVLKRRNEFATGRRCAREALARLGHAPAPLLIGPQREPLWPEGVVGSITHCEGYRAAAVASVRDVAGIGVDAEPDAPLPEGLLGAIALAAERDRVEALYQAQPGPAWDRLLFCAKEAVYKAWYPLARRWLGFDEADIEFHPARGVFEATLLVPGPVKRFEGRFTSGRGLLIAAIATTHGEFHV